MDNNALHLAIIIGSTREGRFAPTVASWFAAQAGERRDLKIGRASCRERVFVGV